MAARRRRFRSRVAATDAVVARLNAFGESSAMAVLLTADLGLVHAVAKGAKRVSNGYRGPLDKGVLYQVRLGRRATEGPSHLHSSAVRESFPVLRRDPARFHVAALVLEVAADLMRENEPNGELFRLTAFCCKVLDRAPPERLGLVAALFLARAVRLAGHAPELDSCVECGRPLDDAERPLISPGRGGVLHGDCAQAEPGTRTVPRTVLALLREFWRSPAAEVLAMDPPARRLRALRRLLEDWLQHVLERRFRAALPMEREIARLRRA